MTTEEKIKLLRGRARGLRAMHFTMASAASIASGQGEYGVSNACWSLQGKLKARHKEVNRQICLLQNPNWPQKKSDAGR